MSTSTCRGAIIEDLDMKSDRCKRPTLLIKRTQEMRTGRTSKAPKMLILPKKEVVTFVKEKNFTVDEGISLQNLRINASYPAEVHLVIKTNTLDSVMASGLIVWNGHVIPLIFYPGVRNGPLTNTWSTCMRFLTPGMIKHNYLNKTILV